MIVVLGLPLNVATIILGCIFSMLLKDFRACGSRRIPITLRMALTVFLHANVEINVHPSPVSCYLISSSLWWYLFSCTHTMFMLCSSADDVCSSSWSILFKALALNVAICIVLLHWRNFCLCLSSVADYSNTEARASTSAECAPFLLVWRAMGFGRMVWVRIMVIFRLLYFFTSSIDTILKDE